jgi:hypothetical protein
VEKKAAEKLQKQKEKAERQKQRQQQAAAAAVAAVPGPVGPVKKVKVKALRLKRGMKVRVGAGAVRLQPAALQWAYSAQACVSSTIGFVLVRTHIIRGCSAWRQGSSLVSCESCW